MSAKIILVTGGRGMLARAIEAAIETAEKRSDEQWHFVDIEEGDLLDYKATCDIFERIRPTHVIHLAAFVGGLYRMLRYSHEMFMYDGIPSNSNLGYAMAKRMIDIFNRTYHAQYKSGLFTSVIPINMFGPHDNFNLEHGHVVANIIHKTHLTKQTGKALTLYGTGAARRQFLFAPDAAKLMIWVLRDYNEIEPLLLTNDPKAEMSIQELVKRIATVMEYTGDILHDTSKSDGRLQWTASNAKLMKYLPNFQYTDFDEALKLTSDWFKDHYDTARK